jgi:hypothetical protein
VDWERGRFRVCSPKLEHLEGGGVRWVPIFPELRPNLEQAFEQSRRGRRARHLPLPRQQREPANAASPLLVTDDHFAQANNLDSAPNSAPTAQNTAQQGARTVSHQTEKTPELPGFFADSAAFSAVGQYPSVPPRGLEPLS